MRNRRSGKGAVAALVWTLLASLTCDAALQQERFEEELLLYPLPGGRTLAHFSFVSQGPASAHGALVRPAVVGLAKGLPVDSVELALTRGRWLPRWGASPLREAPPGAELLTTFSSGVSEAMLPGAWAVLAQTLGGLFCASLGQLQKGDGLLVDAVEAKAGPGEQGKQRLLAYGALPGEAVCTENLTPWLKLLPCRDAGGLAALLTDRALLFGAEYHSMRLAL